MREPPQNACGMAPSLLNFGFHIRELPGFCHDSRENGMRKVFVRFAFKRTLRENVLVKNNKLGLLQMWKIHKNKEKCKLILTKMINGVIYITSINLLNKVINQIK